jgi:hypothetical protein
MDCMPAGKLTITVQPLIDELKQHMQDKQDINQRPAALTWFAYVLEVAFYKGSYSTPKQFIILTFDAAMEQLLLDIMQTVQPADQQLLAHDIGCVLELAMYQSLGRNIPSTSSEEESRAFLKDLQNATRRLQKQLPYDMSIALNSVQAALSCRAAISTPAAQATSTPLRPSEGEQYKNTGDSDFEELVRSLEGMQLVEHLGSRSSSDVQAICKRYPLLQGIADVELQTSKRQDAVLLSRTQEMRELPSKPPGPLIVSYTG